METGLRAHRALEVLLVEDSPADVRLTREAMRRWDSTVNLHVVCDGVAAMEFLRREGAYPHAVRPDLVLLDFNLPKKDGREVLAEVKQDKSLRNLPIVVLTTSAAQEDVAQSYGLNANAYVRKPVGLAEFFKAMRAIEVFWLDVATLPQVGTR